MSVPHSRTDPQVYDVSSEKETSGSLTEGRCSSLKLCSHPAVARRSRRQFTCVTKDLDDQSPSIWRFLSWVAYSRGLAGRNQITDDERLRCPLIWCRAVLGDQNMLLEHVFTCAHLSDGRYWCFYCQKEESFAPFQCKHCQVPAFRKERLSMRAKRIFRWLGTKTHHKDHQVFDPPAPPKGTLCASRNQCFEYLPKCHDISPKAAEMDDHEVFREPLDNHKSGLSELSGCDVLPAELSGQSASTSELQDSCLGSKSLRYLSNDESTTSVPYYASMDSVQAQALPAASFDVYEPLSQFRMNGNKPGTLEGSLPPLQSPISPQHDEWMAASYAEAISDSPTNTDFSAISLFTKSFVNDISPPSTRNSTMQIFSQSPLAVDGLSEYLPTRPRMHDYMNEMPHNISEEDPSSAELVSNTPADAFHVNSPHWLTPKDLLNDFWRVLALHVKESSERLNMLLDSPVIGHLLSMTADTIASTGFSTWREALNGYLPTTIPDSYALVHVAYACAIVIYDGQVENHVKRLFTHSLSIGTEGLSDEDKSIYTNIVWSIWSPGVEDVRLSQFATAEHNTRPMQPPNVHSRVKGKAPLELYSNKDNEIFNVLSHFLDIFEGTTFYGEMSAVGKLSNGFRDENFIRTIEENVTTPLIEGHFQPDPSLEGFIKIVQKIDNLVHIGQITTAREVEVGLKWAGRSTTQSMELYGIFSDRVKDLCSVVCHQLREDPALRNESYIEGINAMWINLEMVIADAMQSNSDGDHLHQAYIGSGSSSITVEQESSLLDNILNDPAVDGLSQSNITQAELCRRSAIKRKRRSTSSRASTPETGPSPSSSASSNTLADSSESEYSRCSLCDFRPTGERRWHKRTMKRHFIARHDLDHKEIHSCSYKGCQRSYTRADNLAYHIRTVHLRTKRQCNSDVSLGTRGMETSPESDSRNGP